MNVLEYAKNLSAEEIAAKIASSGLREYGVYREPVTDRWKAVLDSRKEEGVEQELVLVAALNNADTRGVLLEILKENPQKVLDGMNIAAYALGAKKKVLYIPEYAGNLAEELREKADAAGVILEIGIVNVRAEKYNIVDHLVTMAEIAELFADSYIPGLYVSVNGGKCKKYAEDMTVREVLSDAGADVSDVKVYETGYTFSPETIADKTIKEAGIANGVLAVLTSANCMIQETEARIAASRRQSCGKCAFCREGLIQLHGMETDIKEGRGKSEYVEIIKEIGSAMTYSTPCSMGQESAKAALSSATLCEREYEEHIKKKNCPAGVCFNKTVIYIDPQKCEGCGECADVCPKDCIEGKNKFIHMIDEFDCTQCGKCMEVCEYDAVVSTNGKLPKLPDKLTKCGKFKKH